MKREPMREILMIKHGVVLTMDRKRRMLEDGAVVIEGDKIVAVGKTHEIEKMYKGDTVVNAKGKAVLPGLISIHHHSAVFEHGLFEEAGLEEYLDELYYPVIRALKPENVYIDALLAYAEAIKTGTTCVLDMYVHMNHCARAAEEIGIRAVLSSTGGDGAEGLESVEDNERVLLSKHGVANERVSVWFGIEWVPLCSPEFVMKVREKANKYGVGVHMHLNESLKEVEISKELFKKRPLEHVYDLGVLGPDTVAAHCVWLSNKEIKILRETGTHVAHCPVSNMKLGVGVAPISRLIDERINVGLGPDDMTCNNNLDMFEVMKYASLLQKVTGLDASLVPSKKVLEMATVNGAKALGMGRLIGSIEPGKKADIIIVNLRSPRFTPVLFGEYFNLYSHLIYSAHGDDVESTIIDGKLVMDKRKLTTIDEDRLIDTGTKVAMEVLKRRKEYIK